MTTAGTDNEGVLRGTRGLVVEDELFIALDIEAALQEAGADVVGPFSELSDAVAAAENETLSFAILDIRLARVTTQPVCDLLTERGIPFLFYSGQPLPEAMTAHYGRVSFIDKPARMADLVHAAKLLLPVSGERSDKAEKSDKARRATS